MSESAGGGASLGRVTDIAGGVTGADAGSMAGDPSDVGMSVGAGDVVYVDEIDGANRDESSRVVSKTLGRLGGKGGLGLPVSTARCDGGRGGRGGGTGLPDSLYVGGAPSILK